MNESHLPKNQRRADLVYIIELDYNREKEKGHKYEIYYIPRSSDLSFSSTLVFVGGFDEIPEEYR